MDLLGSLSLTIQSLLYCSLDLLLAATFEFILGLSSSRVLRIVSLASVLACWTRLNTNSLP